MNSGTQYKFGDVILAAVPFIDSFGVKMRPAMVLFEEYNNIVAIGITSNLKMQGISLTKEEGMLKESIIKTNYFFTTTKKFIKLKLMGLSEEKKKLVKRELINKIK